MTGRRTAVTGAIVAGLIAVGAAVAEPALAAAEPAGMSANTQDSGSGADVLKKFEGLPMESD